MKDRPVLRYGSVCSGIEAASVAWSPLGWKAAFFAEIEPFPCAVLSHHYPEVPNLGDMTEIDGEEWRGKIDLLVGGTPCQAFSVAGQRAGLDDPRGNLTLEFLALAKRIEPQWIVWENVPGVISIDDGETFKTILATLNNLGYSIEFDILDAQFFGVPQRRRRVFLICHNIALGRKRKTTTFAITALTCLTDMLLGILAGHCEASSIGAKNSDWPNRFSPDGLRRRMTLFGLEPSKRQENPTAPDAWYSLLSDLDAALARFPREPGDSGSRSEASRSEKDHTEGIPSGNARDASESLSISPLWSLISDEVSNLARSSTTSTATRETAESTIYFCAQASLLIARRMIPYCCSCPSLFDGESSGLTALRAFTNYARQASTDLFRQLGGGLHWNDFIRCASPTIVELERHLGDRANTGTLFPLQDGVPGDSEKGREEGEGVAPSLGNCFTPGRLGGYRRGVGTLRANGGDVGPGSENLIAGTLTAQYAEQSGNGLGEMANGLITHTLRGDGFDAGEDGTGRGTPLVPVGFYHTAGGQSVAATEDRSPSLKSDNTAGGSVAIAYQCQPLHDPDRKGFTRSGDAIPDGTWDRLVSRSNRQGECLIWAGAKNDGYGVVRFLDKTICAHLLSFGIHKGVPLEGMEVDHLCRNRACFNPDHLESVTPGTNNHRSPLTNANKESCKEGHPLRGNNVYARPDRPGRGCVICRTAKNRKISVDQFVWEECENGVRILSPLPAEKGPQGSIPYASGANVGPMGTLREGDGGLTSGVPFIINAAESCATRSHARESQTARCIDSTGSFANAQGGTVVVQPYNIVGGGQNSKSHAYETDTSGCVQSKGLAASGNEAGTLIMQPIPIDMRQASRGETMTNNRREGSSGGAPGVGVGEPGDPSPSLSLSHPPAIAFAWQAGGKQTSLGFDPDSSTVQTLGCEQTPAIASRAAVRRLTPSECERLQGFPSCIDRHIIDVCLDHQKYCVSAVIQCLRSPSNALLADGGENKGLAQSADSCLWNDQESREALVAVHVRMSHEPRLVAIRSQGKYLWSASGAAGSRWSLKSMRPDDFARGIAGLACYLEAAAQTGREASPPNMMPFTLPVNGRWLAEMFGQGKGASASDARSARTEAIRFITSNLGQATLPSGLSGQTWLSFAFGVIGLCIPEGTPPANSFKAVFDVESDWTNIPFRGRPASDGPRYKAIGNSMAIPPMRWIGETIAQVEAIVNP